MLMKTDMKRILSLLALILAVTLPAIGQNTQKINKKNLVIKEWKTDVKSGKKVLDHVTTYSPEGKKLEEIEYNSDGQKWRKPYEYNEFGRKKTQYSYDAKGKLKSMKVFEYITEDA